LRDELIAADTTNGHTMWRYGMAQANSHNAPNANYVKKAARGWKPDEGDGDGEYRRPQSSSGGSPAAQSPGGPVSRLSPEMRQWRREYEDATDIPEFKALVDESVALRKDGKWTAACDITDKLRKMEDDFWEGRQRP